MNPILSLVTGGTSGIGYEVGKLFLELGHHVILVGLPTADDAQLAEKLKAWAGKWEIIITDVSEPAQISSMYEKVNAKWGTPDILVNNAGYATYESFEDLTASECDKLVTVNFLGATRVVKAFLNQMTNRKSGHIINVSSIAGEIVLTPNIMYMAAKQAMSAWSWALSYELQDAGISVSTVCPGRVATNFFNHPTFKDREKRPEMQKALSSHEVAERIVELVKTKKRKLFVPRSYGFISWFYRAIPGVKELLFGHLLSARMKAYKKRNK